MSIKDTNTTEVYEKGGVARGYLDTYLLNLFKNATKQYEIAVIILNHIKEHEEGLLFTTEVYKREDININTFYKCLKKLKDAHLIRKEGRYYRLDSSFSLRLLRLASEFIAFAGIKSKAQKEEILKTIMGLEG